MKKFLAILAAVSILNFTPTISFAEENSDENYRGRYCDDDENYHRGEHRGYGQGRHRGENYHHYE